MNHLKDSLNCPIQNLTMFALDITVSFLYFFHIFFFISSMFHDSVSIQNKYLISFLSPEFVPPRQRTNPVKFAIERKDMIQRRKVLNIPEFHVGKKC